jgi:hypothetical protein
MKCCGFSSDYGRSGVAAKQIIDLQGDRIFVQANGG